VLRAQLRRLGELHVCGAHGNIRLQLRWLHLPERRVAAANSALATIPPLAATVPSIAAACTTCAAAPAFARTSTPATTATAPASVATTCTTATITTTTTAAVVWLYRCKLELSVLGEPGPKPVHG
jgi:hypothetical protein